MLLPSPSLALPTHNHYPEFCISFSIVYLMLYCWVSIIFGLYKKRGTLLFAQHCISYIRWCFHDVPSFLCFLGCVIFLHIFLLMGIAVAFWFCFDESLSLLGVMPILKRKKLRQKLAQDLPVNEWLNQDLNLDLPSAKTLSFSIKSRICLPVR